ncbi:MAG: hypothetical protein J2P46_05675 [Zavarzinella sp.]|nr:hypothetical protein [Zavarzinella sp.]
MRVQVRWHENTRPELADWADEMAQDDEERRALVHLFIAEAEHELRRTDGAPRDAFQIPGTRPALWWWMYYEDLWLQYAVRDEPWHWSNLIRGRLRKVTILQIRRHAPEGFVP